VINGVYQNAASINALQTWNDVIAQNIAAATKPGYKGKSISFEAALPAGSATDGSVARMPKMITTTNFDQGEVRTTGVDTDFAIKGPGLFQFVRPDGQMVYSRDGGFRLNREGTIVNKQDFPVMGLNGPIRLLPENGNLVAESDGTLWQGDQEVGQLALVQFPRPDHLVDAAGGYMIDRDRPQFASPVIYPLINQGAIESSNISAIREMVDMISVNNAFQANQRVISSIDSALEKAIEILGNT
jgi:flagellar basal-body rod protein FlgF